MPPPPLLLLRLRVAVAPSAPAKPHSLLPNSPSLGRGRCRCRRSSSSWFSNAEPDDEATNTRSRRWWSDADDLKDDEFYDDDGGGVFGGGAGEMFDEPWFSKVFRAYGYVLPVILASMLVATGPQAFAMAMAIPLAQSAISFALRNLSSTTFPGRDRDRDQDYYYSDDFEASSSYRDSSYRRQQSWEPESEPEPGDATTTKGGGFGGWDELDDQYRSSSSRWSDRPGAEDTATTRDGDAAAAVRRRPRMSTTTRYRQAPLLMRLLVAVFPFLGSWFRIL